MDIIAGTIPSGVSVLTIADDLQDIPTSVYLHGNSVADVVEGFVSA